MGYLGAIAFDAWDATASVFNRRRRELRQLRYEAALESARMTRTLNDLAKSTGSPDDDLEFGHGREEVRDRAIQMYLDNPTLRAAVNSYVDQAVGTGLRPQVKLRPEALGITPEQAKEYQQQAEDIFYSEFAEESDVTGRENFWQSQRTVLAHIMVAGEILSLPVMVPQTDPLAIERRVELLESRRLEQPASEPESLTKRAGVGFDENGRPISYSITTRAASEGIGFHPNAYRTFPAYSSSGLPMIFHHFAPIRPGQTRGLSRFHAAIPTIQHRAKYLEAEVIAARMCASIGIVIIQPGGNPLPLGTDKAVKDGQPAFRMQPAMTPVLRPGQDIREFAPNRQAAHVPMILETLDRTIASALNLSYGTLTKNYSKSNFANTRAEIVAERRGMRCDHMLLERSYCQPYLSLVLWEAYVKGRFPSWVQAKDYPDYRRRWCRSIWVPTPGYQWVDPAKDATADKTALELGLTSRTRLARERGADYEELLLEQKHEQDLREELGLVPDTSAESDPPPEQPDPAETDPEDQPDPNDPNQEDQG